MTINRTTLLDFPLPVTGTESGVWGDVTNNGLTQYLDIAVAGALSITGSVTLTTTEGDASTTNIGSTTAQYRTLIVPASGPSANVVITAPSSNRTYHVVNLNATYTVQIRAGSASGVTLGVNQSATVTYDSVAADYVLVGTIGPTVPVARGGTGLTSGTSGGVLAFTATGTLASSGALAANALVIGGGAGVAPSTTTTGTGVVTALGVNTGSAGAFVVNGGALGTPSSGTVTNLTGTASININGTVGATTPTTGAFTTATLSSDLTLNGGTANGVLYLNGSKVATSGSALTFDGTTLTASANAASTGVFKATSTTAQVANLQAQNDAGTALFMGVFGSAAGTSGTLGASSPFVSTNGTQLVFNVNNNSGNFVWGIGSTPAEQMRLTSTGLGIGTSSPSNKFVVSASGAQGLEINPNVSGTTEVLAYNRSGGAWNPLKFITSTFKVNISGGSDALILDSSGNLGLGVTPSAWGTYKAFQTARAGLMGASNDLNLSVNGYYDGANWRYIATAAAGLYNQSGAAHSWHTAASGTAGNAITFTQALTLDANRNLLLNGTSAGASAVGTLAIFNGTAPTGSVTNGIILYAEDVSSSSELKVRDEAGNVTTLSPHNFSLIPEGPSEDMAWAYYSEKGGKRINVDMLKLARMVEKLTGEKLVYES